MPPSQLDAQLADLELDAAPPLRKQPPLEEAAATGADTQACTRAEGLLNGIVVCWGALRRWPVYNQLLFQHQQSCSNGTCRVRKWLQMRRRSL
jgi:hypothetical protein